MTAAVQEQETQMASFGSDSNIPIHLIIVARFCKSEPLLKQQMINSSK